MRMLNRASLIVMPTVLALAMSGTQGASAAATSAGVPAPASAPSAAPSSPSVLADPGKILTPGWQKSTDRAVTTIGDDNGLNVLAADSSSGYQWRTAASLSEPGFDTPQWIGQDCVTASGTYAAVVYAPWSYSNNTDDLDHGAFAAIVNLVTGAVHKLPEQVSLSYYSPGCGNGDTVAFSAVDADTSTTTTRIDLVNAATGALQQSTMVPGQVTSPVPYAGGVAAALGNAVVSISPKGATSTLANVGGIAFDLHPDSQGGLGFEVPSGTAKVTVQRYSAGKTTLLGTGGLGAVQLQGAAGHDYLIGPGAAAIKLGAKPAGGWADLGGAANSTPSTDGQLLLTSVSNHVDAAALGSEQPSASAGSDAQTKTAQTAAADAADNLISIDATVTGTGKAASFTLAPAALQPAAGNTASPSLGLLMSPTTTPDPGTTKNSAVKPAASSSGYSTTDADDGANPATAPWDPIRGCAVARNDPSIQTFQATAQQIEWAADLAVQGQLTTARAANWEGSGVSVPWTPQSMFPLQKLDGGGSVPAQVLLGVLAQESNTLQASPHAVDGETGNTEQGGFYGSVDNSSVPAGTSWSDVDCGYGVGQVTTGMTIENLSPVADGSSSFTVPEEQQAIATDYASNIAATLNMLIDKWNQLYTLGILANGGSPQYIENWWFALWAYNSGVEPDTANGNTTGCNPGPTCTDAGGSGGNWGLGWANNPADPAYQADRTMFTNSNYDTAHPQYWSYPEKVVGWAATPLARFNYAGGNWASAYAAGSWPSSGALIAEPPHSQFCAPSVNHCTADSATDVNGQPDTAGLCSLANSHCWWNTWSSWTTCSKYCGTQVLTYTSASARPSYTDIYPPDCNTSSLPANTVIVADATTPSVATCDQTAKDQGSFSLSFPDDPAGGCAAPCIDYPGKIDFHQVGTGFGGHIWFTHTEQTATVTGTWTPPSSVKGWTRVLIHIPQSGAITQQAGYMVGPDPNGRYETRYVDQHLNQNGWVDLGVFDLAAGATVSLNNQALDGDGSADIAFDAIGFAPLAAKPANVVVQLGDSYSSGEGAAPFLPGTDIGYGTSEWNACRRSELSWIRDAILPGETDIVGSLENSYDPSMDEQSLACSGAETGNVDSNITDYDFGQNGQFDEMPQIQAGYLDSNTTLVTLTVGGNDAGFSGVLQDCVSSPSGCPPTATVESKMDSIVGRISQVLEDIRSEAPNAKIVLMGYPQLFDVNGPSLTCAAASGMPASDMSLINQWALYMATDQQKAVTAANAEIASLNEGAAVVYNDTAVLSAFNGYQICDGTEGINAIVLGQTGPGDFSCSPSTLFDTYCVSRESFHPNTTGTLRYASALQSILGTHTSVVKAVPSTGPPKAGQAPRE